MLCSSALVVALAAGAGPPPIAHLPYPATPGAPAEPVLLVRETAGVARRDEVLRSGVPLARGLGVYDLAGVAVVDGDGAPVPAQLRVLARWHAGRDDPAAPIQWLLVSFPASVEAGGTARYRLVLDGSAGPPPAPERPLVVRRLGARVEVDTGVARFLLGGDPGTLFDEVHADDGTRLVAGGAMTAGGEGGTWEHPGRRRVVVEEAGPLAAVVVVEGTYAMPAVGGGGLGSFRRYLFTAGSPTALVRQAVTWEGDRCGLDALSCGGRPNGVRLSSLRDTLELEPGTGLALTALTERGGPPLHAAAAAGNGARIRQLLRPRRQAPLAFEAALPGGVGARGAKADGALLAAAGPRGTVAVALGHMHRYEPQALRLLPAAAPGAGPRLALDLADGPVWLANHQGLFANLAVAALSGSPSAAELEAAVWAPLNRPLRAWPTPGWWASSGAVGEVPTAPLGSTLGAYDRLLRRTLERTLTGVEGAGLSGLTTFGLYPRFWGNPLYADELDCGGGDPTPGEAWDDKFWCGAWTDYHNATAAVARWAMRSGEVAWLDELAFPAALRMLHTQIIQCAPGDDHDRCGQAPTGYGAYRSDNNSSHAYFDNLFLYYWLTGDETVVRTLERGAAWQRGFLCDTRGGDPPGPTCAPDRPIADPWAALDGRTAAQWYAAFRFLGLAGDDPSYLDDWTSNTARWLTLYYAQPRSGGVDLGFIIPSAGGSFDYLSAPGTYWTSALWMASLYDFELLFELERDTADAPLGRPPLAPSAVQDAWARTLLAVSTLTPFSRGSAAGPWPDSIAFTFAGPRVGGRLAALTADLDPNRNGNPCEVCGELGPGVCADLCLYDTGKATLAAVLARSADRTGDPALAALAESFTRHALASALANPQPLNKETGQYLSRLHAAVARLAARGVRFWE